MISYIQLDSLSFHFIITCIERKLERKLEKEANLVRNGV